MKRFLLLCLIPFTTLVFPMAATAAEFEEGVDYEVLSNPVPTNTGNKIEVLEFFWYGCPHCYNFEPVLKRWQETMPSDVELIKQPAIFRPEWDLQARAYFAGQALGVLDKSHDAMFTAMHEMRKPLNTEAQILEVFKGIGVSEADFARAFKSFAVESKVRRARELHKTYGVDSVPNVIVGGKYRTNASLAGENKNVIKVVDFLIKKVRAESKK
ncbi:MAG: thiol:disulfide interchange protein DsbA/DsbL [Pseudomonadota bacterium]